MNTELEHLRKARGLLASGWTQGAMARNTQGLKVSPAFPGASCFCLIGAVLRATGGNDPFARAFRIIDAASGRRVFFASEWNDDPSRTQSDVLALVDRAIELEEAGK